MPAGGTIRGRPAARALRSRASVLMALVWALALLARPAAALTVGAGGPSPLEVTPLWYHGAGEFGLATPVAFDWTATPSNRWLPAATGAPAQPLSIVQMLERTPIQHPQQPAASSNPQTPTGVPTKAVPFVGDSLWTVRNETGETLTAPLLVVTFVESRASAAPNVPFALDDRLVDVLQYTAQGQTYQFGAIPLGPLAPGASKQVRIRYIVGGALPLVEGSYRLPQLAVSGVLDATPIPEPSLALLIGGGLAAVARARRRRAG